MLLFVEVLKHCAQQSLTFLSFFFLPFLETAYNTTHGSSTHCPTSLMFDKQWDDGTGSGNEGKFMFSMTDKLTVPSDLEAGEYSLSWRWDCEQTPQVWNSCADVSITV